MPYGERDAAAEASDDAALRALGLEAAPEGEDEEAKRVWRVEWTSTAAASTRFNSPPASATPLKPSGYSSSMNEVGVCPARKRCRIHSFGQVFICSISMIRL